MLTDLESESQDVRTAASSEILKKRQDEARAVTLLVQKYLAIAGREGTAKDNILLLGKMRSLEAVPLLVRNLTFTVFYAQTLRPQPIEDQCPAVQALIDIGPPSFAPLLQRLKDEDGDMLQRAGAAVIRGVMSKDWAVAIIESEIKGVASPAVKDRLQKVLQYVKTLP